MTETPLVVDTNILLYLLNKDDKIASLLDQIPVFISYVTEIELLSYHNLTESEFKKVEQLIENCTIVELNSEIKKSAINLRRKYRLKVNDAVVSATSLYLHIPLLTADSDFLKITELDLRFYEK